MDISQLQNNEVLMKFLDAALLCTYETLKIQTLNIHTF